MGLQHVRHRQEAIHQHHHRLSEGTTRTTHWSANSTFPPFVSFIIVSAPQSLIPDIKVNQEAVVELHPEELQLSGDDENMDSNHGDQDKGLKIRRTVTQVRGTVEYIGQSQSDIIF